MLEAHLGKSPDAILPDQLVILQRVFDSACVAARISKNTPQAEGLAATLLHLYHTGVQDADRLEDMLASIDFI